jgi:hypothetical protein
MGLCPRGMGFSRRLLSVVATGGLIVGLLATGLWVVRMEGSNMGLTPFGLLTPSQVTTPLLIFHFFDATRKPGLEPTSDFGDLAHKVGILRMELQAIALPPHVCLEHAAGGSAPIEYPTPYPSFPAYGPQAGRSGGGTYEGFWYRFTALCAHSQEAWFYAEQSPSFAEHFSAAPTPSTFHVGARPVYYFPFDYGEFSLVVRAAIARPEPDGQWTTTEIAPDVGGWITWPGWDKSISVEKSAVQSVANAPPIGMTTVRITFQRPLGRRALTVILLGTLFLFILSLIFIEETANFLEVAVGILFGLWGVREVLIPSYVTGPTMIEPLVLMLYFALVVAVLLRAVRLFVQRRTRSPLRI